MSFKEIDPQKKLPELEEEILDFWDKENIFQKSIDQRAGKPLYSFYDGPPFATGTPHYGHIVASTMKDVVPRYWTMRGFQVERKWGWDCHGLPIENIAEKELGITHKKQIEELGVAKFNETCRSKVLEYVAEWEKVIRRLGRWADMKNAYRTMDLSFMESVWWVFKELWDKGLIYESYRSMHICPRCETTLSQSEVTEGYKTIKDLSVTAEFHLVDEPNTSLLAWTTTPWTLIGNAALAVNRNIDYVKIEKKNMGTGGLVRFILAKNRLKEIFKEEDYKIIDEFKGANLIGKVYEPLFDYYKNIENKENGWKVYDASFVTTDDGTGIVHVAPAYGEDDMNLGKEKNLPFIQHVGMDGVIKKEAGEFAGLNVKPIDDVQETDVEIIKYLAGKNLLFSKEQYEHSYPHCWRCETPLLNYATSSWFVRVTEIKEKAIKKSQEVSWSPKHIKEGRFGKWLEGARDWSISRQRYWASVIPIWICEKCKEAKVVGSVKELENLSGQKITDLHKDKIDPIIFACECGGQFHRVPDVLDTWFDSGSMPYAQVHYPFENEQKFEKIFPAEFIAEGVDQTRAWFYYLHVIATAIKDEVAFKNVVVNGIVLAQDGKKMSKRLQNYPDPMEEFQKYGADAMRLYLLTSPVMQAENLNFNEKDLASFSQGMFRMLWNTYSFFVMYANVGDWNNKSRIMNNGISNILDKWIMSELNILIKNVNEQMEKYELMKASRLFTPFIDDLSNWYLRRSRKRFKSGDAADQKDAFTTLYFILVELSKLLAPFAPFLSEEIYKNLSGNESVHLENYPATDDSKINQDLSVKMQSTRGLIEKGLALRAEENLRTRQPLQSATLRSELGKDFQEILKDEINVKEILINKNLKNDIELDNKLTPELLEEGRLRDLMRDIQDLRKKAGLNPGDKVDLYYQKSSDAAALIKKFAKAIKAETNITEIMEEERGENDLWLGEK